MITRITSCEFGYGWTSSASQLATIKTFRQKYRPEYGDRAAALKIYGSTKKCDVANDEILMLFSYLFQYSASSSGYWIYDKMVLQLENVIDYLNDLHSEPRDRTQSQHHVLMKSEPHHKALVRKYDYVTLTDHSCGHDCKDFEGLDVTGL